MRLIRIIALLPGEAAVICSACKFLPRRSELRFQLIAAQNELPQVNNSPLELVSWESLPEPDSFLGITIFASLQSHQLWTQHHALSSPALGIYKNLLIMEIQGHSLVPEFLISNGYALYIVNNDSAIDYISADISFINLPDVTHFYNLKTDNHVLLTANHQLLLTLTSIDNLNWSIIHPDLNAANLILDCTPHPEHKALRDIQLLSRYLEIGNADLSANLDIEAIRKLRFTDKTSYSFFADNYDQYMAHVDYDLWINRILRWYKQHSSRPLQRILELACGTANVSCKLVAKGYHVDASDLSANMLMIAAQKPFKPNLYQASLTDPIPRQDYDLIICMFDSINYLQKTTDIDQLLANAYNALGDHGLFIFDISTRQNSEENFDDICSLTRYEDGIMVHRAWFEQLHMLQKSSLRYFHEELVGYSQQHELHVQRVYLSSELVNLVRHSQLTIKAIYSIESERNLYPKQVQTADDRYPRLFFVLSKEQ